MKLCEACYRGSHEHCSAQVRAADMPCGCEHCWGTGGSKAFYKRRDDDYKCSQEASKPIIVCSPNPQTQGNSEGI